MPKDHLNSETDVSLLDALADLSTEHQSLAKKIEAVTAKATQHLQHDAEQTGRLADAEVEIEHLRAELASEVLKRVEAEGQLHTLAAAVGPLQTIMNQIAPIIDAWADPNKATTRGSTAGQTPPNGPEKSCEAANSTSLNMSTGTRERSIEQDGKSQAKDAVERTEDTDSSAVPKCVAMSPENTSPEDEGSRAAEDSTEPSQPAPTAGAQILIELNATEADALLRIARQRGYPDVGCLAAHLLRAKLERETARNRESAKQINKASTRS